VSIALHPPAVKQVFVVLDRHGVKVWIDRILGIVKTVGVSVDSIFVLEHLGIFLTFYVTFFSLFHILCICTIGREFPTFDKNV
jgi:hypothetical protein